MTVAPLRPRVLFVEGHSRAELCEELDRVRDRLSRRSASELPPAELTARGVRDPGGHRVAMVATSNGDALERTAAAQRSLRDPGCTRIHNPAGLYYFAEPLGRDGKVAFLVPAEGAQYPSMLSDLRAILQSGPWLRTIERGVSSGRWATHEDKSSLADGWVTFAITLTFFELLERLGVSPDMAAGHSFGELAALLAAGYVAPANDEDLCRLLASVDTDLRDARVQQRLAKAASALVVAPDPGVIGRVLERHRGRLFLSADNCVHQAMLGGFEDAVDKAIEELARGGAICQRLPDPMAPHTPLLEGLAEQFTRSAAAVAIGTPRLVVYSGATAAPIPSEPAEVRRRIARNWIEPVRFREVIAAMHRDGARVFVDVGPRGVLAGFVDDTLRGVPHVAIAMNLSGRAADEQVCHAVALLGAHHVRLDLRGVDPDADLVPRSASSRDMQSPAPSLPFIRGLPPPADDVVATCKLELEEDLFLLDHAFGGRISNDDPALLPLILIPFTLSLEMLAEAAVTLVRDSFVVGLRDVRAPRWMAVDEAGLPLVFTARLEREGRVHVEIRSGKDGAPFVEGTVLLERARRRSPTAAPWAGTAQPSPTLTTADYEGPEKRTFLGPLYHTVRQVPWADASGAEALLVAPDGRRVFRSRDSVAFLVDPLLIEGVGHAAAYSIQSRFDRWATVLPFELGELDLFGAGVPPGTEVRCLLSARPADDPVGRFDASLVAPDGSLVGAVKGWTTWHVFLPPRFRAFLFSPLDAFLSSPDEDIGPGARQIQAFEPSFIESMGGLWLRALRDLVLNRAERAAWLTWGASDAERLLCLMGRIVAKDAVRSILSARTGRRFGAADIDLGPERAIPTRFTLSSWTLRIEVSRDGDAWSAVVREEGVAHDD